MEYKTFTELDKKVDELVALEQYSKAIDLLQRARQKFPDNLWEALQYEGYIWIRLEEYEKCLDIVEECVANGLFVGIDNWHVLEPFRHTERFKAIEAEDHRLKALAQMKAKMEYEVHTPEGYSPEKQYPLFITLHGDELVSNWIAVGRREEYLSRQLTQEIATESIEETLDYLADSPELDELMAAQSMDLVDDIFVDEIRESYSNTSLILTEWFSKVILRRKGQVAVASATISDEKPGQEQGD